MKITKQILEEMIREEMINEGFLSWIKEHAPTIAGILGVVSTLGTIGGAGYEVMERGEKEVIENSVQELNGMEPEQVEELRSKSLNNDVMNQIWIEYDAQSELNVAPSSDSWNENKSRLEQFIAEELKNALGERTQVSQKDFKNMSARDALRASGGDDKALRKAIGDFVALGSPDRVSELAQAIEDYQYSDSYLVNTARDLLAHDIGQKASAGRAEREKLAQQINERLDIIQEELKNVLNEKAGDRKHASFSGGYMAGLAQQPAGSEVTDLPPEAMKELSQLMNEPHIKKIQDEERRGVLMNFFVDHLKEKYSA